MAKKKKLIKAKPRLKKAKKVLKKPKKFLSKKRAAPKKSTRKKPLLKKKSSLKPKKIVRKKPANQLAMGGQEQFLPKSFFKAKIRVIGIGGGGGSIVSEIGRSLHKASFVVADTDTRAFKKKSGIKNFLFGQKLTHGLGTGVNPQLGRDAALQEKERITRLFVEQDIVIFIASLGGGLGSGATQVFLEAAKDFKGITFGIFTLPFKFEGKNKYKIAVKSLANLQRGLNVSLTIPNEKIFKVISPNTAITDAFSIVNKSLIEGLESLIDLIYSPGIINIDFADLASILKGKGNLAFLNTVEASGKDRAKEVLEKILHNPLYQHIPSSQKSNNGFVAQNVIFNIEGPASISMFEVDIISKAISALNPKAKIIFGISKNTQFKNKIKTTLLMTGGGIEVLAAVKSPLSEIPPVVKKIVLKKPAKNPVAKKTTTSVTKIKKQKAKKPKIFLPEQSFPVFKPMPMPTGAIKLGVRKVQPVSFDQFEAIALASNKYRKRLLGQKYFWL